MQTLSTHRYLLLISDGPTLSFLLSYFECTACCEDSHLWPFLWRTPEVSAATLCKRDHVYSYLSSVLWEITVLLAVMLFLVLLSNSLFFICVGGSIVRSGSRPS